MRLLFGYCIGPCSCSCSYRSLIFKVNVDYWCLVKCHVFTASAAPVFPRHLSMYHIPILVIYISLCRSAYNRYLRSRRHCLWYVPRIPMKWETWMFELRSTIVRARIKNQRWRTGGSRSLDAKSSFIDEVTNALFPLYFLQPVFSCILNVTDQNHLASKYYIPINAHDESRSCTLFSTSCHYQVVIVENPDITSPYEW